MFGIINAILQFVLGGFKQLIGGGGAKAPPKPVDVVSQEAAETPALAATAARDEQTVADVKAAQTAQEAADEKVRSSTDAGTAVRADSVRDPASIYADDGFKRPD